MPVQAEAKHDEDPYDAERHSNHDSQAASGLLRRDLETEVRLRDLGLYRLRNVEGAERLYQVEYGGMPASDFPPLRAERAHSGNLPAQLTRFFGREREIAQLVQLLTAGDVRLVTLTGPGGSGKSRLAIEAGPRMLEAFSGAVWFVPE